MTDPNAPAPADQPHATPPPADQPSAYQPPADAPGASTAPPAYAPPAYAPPAQPDYPGQANQAGYGATTPVPGKTLGIVAFVLSFFVQLVALVLGIVALVQSRKAGAKNGWAVAAIIISVVLGILAIIIGGILIAGLLAFAGACGELGPGVWELTNGQTITCG